MTFAKYYYYSRTCFAANKIIPEKISRWPSFKQYIQMKFSQKITNESLYRHLFSIKGTIVLFAKKGFSFIFFFFFNARPSILLCARYLKPYSVHTWFLINFRVKLKNFQVKTISIWRHTGCITKSTSRRQIVLLFVPPKKEKRDNTGNNESLRGYVRLCFFFVDVICSSIILNLAYRCE